MQLVEPTQLTDIYHGYTFDPYQSLAKELESFNPGEIGPGQN